MEINPYKAPQAEVGGATIGQIAAASGEPTEAMINGLKGTGPWVLLLGILGFIAGGFMLLSGLSSAVAIPLVGMHGVESTGVVAVFAAFYLVCGASCGATSYYLARYFQAISRVRRTRSLGDVEKALGVQQRFWMVMGITTIILLVLGLLFIVVAFSMTMASSFP